jgi:hypothetical protein
LVWAKTSPHGRNGFSCNPPTIEYLAQRFFSLAFHDRVTQFIQHPHEFLVIGVQQSDTDGHFFIPVDQRHLSSFLAHRDRGDTAFRLRTKKHAEKRRGSLLVYGYLFETLLFRVPEATNSALQV